MSDTSKIEWTDATWNPVRGCSIVSKGCTNCYAMKQAHRFAGAGQAYEGLTQMSRGGPVWTGKVRLVPELLDQPLRRKTPRLIFVNSMSDLFHEDVPDEFIDQIFAVMGSCPWHTFQILTKRPDRMREWFNEKWQIPPEWSQRQLHQELQARARALGITKMLPEFTPQTKGEDRFDQVYAAYDWMSLTSKAFNGDRFWTTEGRSHLLANPWPLQNVWLGVSVEDQAAADERIPLLLQTPAAVRWISAEPLLGPIDMRDAQNDIGEPRFSYLTKIDGTGPQIDWVVVGGESGPGARGCRVADVRSIVRQCRIAGVPVFVKQLGAYVVDRNDAGFDGCEPDSWPNMDPMDIEYNIHGFKEEYQGADVRVRLGNRKGGAMCEWPEDLRVREYPAQ